MALTLIALYYYVSDCHARHLRWQVQRFSSNALEGQISDEELLTIYLFCVAFQERTTLKSMHRYIQQHWPGYFPALPAYQTFVNRINRLADAFPLLIHQLINDLGVCDQDAQVLLLDSMPIITCSAKRQPKVALELVDKTYCASKGFYYHGVKLHVLGQRRSGSLPLPFALGITQASAHDLTCLRPVLGRISGKIIVADKAYADQKLRVQVLDKQQVELLTPIKGVKNTPELLAHFDRASNDLFSRAVSSLRQPIESFFSWLQQKTQIHLASKVRSTLGLQVHIFGKIAAALCILMKFNP